MKKGCKGMNTVQIEQDIREFVAARFLFGRQDELGDDLSLLGNVIDSTGALELLVFLQEHFGISLGDEDMAPENFDSVQSIAAYVERKLKARANYAQARHSSE